MKKSNQDIRLLAAGSDIRLWQIADKLGYNDAYFSRKLRKELTAEEKKRIRKIISELRAEVNNERAG